MATYTVTVRERDGQLWFTIPAAIRRSLRLRAGDTGRWRKMRGENSYIITFFRRGRTKRRLGVVNADLRSARGRLDARKVADAFGIPYPEFAEIIDVNLQTMLRSSDTYSLQPKLMDFDRIGRLRLLGKVTPMFFRKWLDTEIESLRGRSALDWIRRGKAEIVANLVDNLATGQPI